MHKLTLFCLLLQSLFIFGTVNCGKNESEQKSVQTVYKSGLATSLINGGFNIAKKIVVFTAVQVKGCVYAGKAIHCAIQTYKETGNMTIAAQKSASDLKSAIDIFMGIPGVKLSVTLLNDFKNNESWGTIFINGGRETIDMLPFGKRARLKAMATIQAIKDFNEAFQDVLAEQSPGKKVEERSTLKKIKQKEKPVANIAIEEFPDNGGEENLESIEDGELMMAMTGLGAIQAIREGKSLEKLVAEGVEGTLMTNAYRHPSVLDLIAYYDNKDNQSLNPSKNRAAKTRSGKTSH